MNLRLTPAPLERVQTPQVGDDDARLMQRIATGDMAAFATLIRRHQRAAHRLAYHVTGAADAADDITQEAFLRTFRSARTFKPAAAFTTFLHRIVVNLCLDRAKRPKLALLHEDRPDDASEPGQIIAQAERLAAVRKAIADLPARQRIALVFHRFEGLSHAAIAESTGWSESAVEALLVRAYAQLRGRLKDWKH